MSDVVLADGAVEGELHETVVTLTPGAVISLDCSKGGVFTLSQTDGTAGTINASNVTDGEHIVLVVTTTGTTGETLTFGTNFTTTGTLAVGVVSGKKFVVNFVADGGKLIEVSRTTAM